MVKDEGLSIYIFKDNKKCWEILNESAKLHFQIAYCVSN